MHHRRIVAVGLLVLATSVATAAVADAQETSTTTPTGTETTLPTGTETTTPSGTACTKGVTYTLLKSRKKGKIEVTVERANIRRLPGTDCTIYASVKRHVKLKATGRRARASKLTWLEIYSNELGHAWVAAKLVKPVK